MKLIDIIKRVFLANRPRQTRQSEKPSLSRANWNEIGDLWVNSHHLIADIVRKQLPLDDLAISNMVDVPVSATRILEVDVNVLDVRESTVQPLGEDRIAVSLPVCALIDAEFLCECQHCPELLGNESLWIEDSEWSDGTALVTGLFEVSFSITCIADRASFRVQKWEVNSPELVGPFR